MATSPFKIAVKLDNDIVEDKPSQTRSLLLALILGVLGAVLNSFPIELAYNISLIIGNLAFILAAAYLRPALTLLCAFICVAPLLVLWGHPYGFITFGCEALFVSYMRTRGWYLPTADFLYWLVIGMPLTAIIVWLNATGTQEYLLFSLFKQGINAVFYTALAVISIFVFGDKLNRLVKSQQPALVKNLKEYLHYILWVMSAFFVVGICLFLSKSLNDIQEQQFEDKLDISSQYLGRIIEDYLENHKKAINQMAYILSNVEPNSYDDALIKGHELYPGFLTMMITNQEANIVSASPKTLMDNIPDSGFSVADRAYFNQAFFHEYLYVSPVFLGRGFGAEPIIAISSPIYAHNNEKPVGIVEGSLNLNLFEEIRPNTENNRAFEVVLTDENDNVIYADAKLALTTLSKFNFSFNQAKFEDKLMMIDTYSSSKKHYLYRKMGLSNGWKVFVLIEHNQFLQLIERQYLTIFMSLTLIFIFVIILANQFANTLNRPLAFALNELSNDDARDGYKPIPFDAPTEFLTLYQQLQYAKDKLLKQQFILEEKVVKRTVELNEANKALKKLANIDSLTGLYNRRYLENKFGEFQAILARNNATMVVAMLDLDHFKKLNDQNGHLVGDYCLASVGKLIKDKFDRRSDIVARFGGEEFIIIAQHDEQSGVLQKLEELRKNIENHRFSYDEHESINMTISIGALTTYATFSEDIDDWIRLADEQLYQAKNEGRNRLSAKHLATPPTST